MTIEFVSTILSALDMGMRIGESLRRRNLPPLRLEYTCDGTWMYLKVENVSDCCIRSIGIDRDYSDAVRTYFDNEENNRFAGRTFDLGPHETKRDIIGYFPPCLDYNPYPAITLDVSYRLKKKAKKYRRDVQLTMRSAARTRVRNHS